VCAEGTKASKIYIVKSGQFEIIRSKLNNIKINPKSGVISM
jgi:CRP-like cAMP-binding protein